MFLKPLTALAFAIASVASASATPATRQQVAFPGAEGFGRYALGGRGGAVFHVTTLDDSGPGSLRASVEARGPRTVVFDLGGTITLLSPLKISRSNITIAGQTAPGDGITLRGQPLIIAANDVIVRYLRVRLGDESGVQEDALSITRGRRIIIDHVSASWSVDETLSAGSRYSPPEEGIHDLTVQWSLIAESLNASVHLKGRHGYGSLIRGGHGARFSWHHNLWANHQARMPRPGNYNSAAIDPEGPLFEFRNNVFYNWGGGRAGYNADTAARAFERVLAGAGASKARDAVDQRIVAGVRNRTGGLINSQTEVGGWPVLKSGPAWIDCDGDGMPDDWERSHGFDPTNASDGAQDRNGDGWTNLEDWLNSLV